ncbi:MAG: helicase-related protein [Acidimicrobiaceae bacterium]|nr:helicase-related protein [Acidimicrobiaceae bacterium]
MTDQRIDVEAVLADLKDFQRRTARWAFERMFAEKDPAVRFLVADEVGLGKTHVAKGVIAQVIEHLGRSGDKRHDIVYICSNAAIASQNIRKLVPSGITPLTNFSADRLTMLPLKVLNEGDESRAGINVIAITPGTSLNFGRRTGAFTERALAYTFLRAHWGAAVMDRRPAQRIFWHGISAGDPRKRLQGWERWYRKQIAASREEFGRRLAEADRRREARGEQPLRALFDEIVAGLAYKLRIPWKTFQGMAELIGEVRRIMALVGLDSLRPDLVVLDEFQRFKDLLQTTPGDLAVEMAQKLFNYRDPDHGRLTRTLLLSATPYRMYTTADDAEGDHYKDFLDTCAFLFDGDRERVERLGHRFRDLRRELCHPDSLSGADELCRDISEELRNVMARTERLAATPDRSGMLRESSQPVTVQHGDLRAYLRFDGLAEATGHHQPTEYWKSAPYLVNFMESYQFKKLITQDADPSDAGPDVGGMLEPGPGLLSWDDIDAYNELDPENGRLRWLLEDLEQHRAFDLLWIPPSMRYYDTGSVYESSEASDFTKRLIFSGWAVVPKTVSSLVSFAAERHAFAARDHRYSADYGRRGGQRLAFRTVERAERPAPGEAAGARRAAAMTAFLLTWPSPSLAEMGDPRPRDEAGVPLQRSDEQADDKTRVRAETAERPGTQRSIQQLRDRVRSRVSEAVEPLMRKAHASDAVDQSWYWAAPLLLDQQRRPAAVEFLLGADNAPLFQGNRGEGSGGSQGLQAHLDEARRMVATGAGVLGRPPDDLVDALTDLAVGGPAQCALRMICSVTRLDESHCGALANATLLGGAFRHYFNAPEVTAVIENSPAGKSRAAEAPAPYWREVVRHCVDGNLQAVLDEHGHVLRDWLGHLNVANDEQRASAADSIGGKIAEALSLRTSSYRVDIAAREQPHEAPPVFDRHTMRTRFAVAFADQSLDGGGVNRIGSVAAAFNSPFWPFVLASTSVGQEGLDFHLWCHAVVHWNLPYNPVDLEQREGRVHRYKGHAVRRNIATKLAPDLLADGSIGGADPWGRLFDTATSERPAEDDEMTPYWVFEGPAKIERLVPVMPFSREAAALPRLRKTLAAYRLAFGQPRQEELVEYLGDNLSDEALQQLRIDLSPPDIENAAK